MDGEETQGRVDVQKEAEHFIAAFRGRTVRGLKVSPPEGYTGLIFNCTDNASAKGSLSSSREDARDMKASGRRSTRHAVTEKLEESEEARDALEDSVPVRTIQPTATFSSFTLWNPDIPVDEGRDEYIRAMNEWTKLASVVSIRTLYHADLLTSLTDTPL